MLACATPGLEMVTLAPQKLGLGNSANLFNLPVCEEADVALVSADWYAGLELRDPERAPAVLRSLERCVDVEVAVEARDEVALTMPPRLVDRVACVLAAGGVYRDRDLYNYEVGPRYPGANWTEKRRPRASQYTTAQLDKVRLSVPCFLLVVPEVRRATRALERQRMIGVSGGMTRSELLVRNLADTVLADVVSILARSQRRSKAVHCVGSLTNPQRIDFVRLVSEFSGEHGLNDLETAIVFPEGAVPVAEPTLRKAAKPYLRRTVSRPRFVLEMCRHKVVVAPTGAGELTYRHGEAMAAGAALVCQDLSHIETLFPFRSGANVTYCRPDLGDLTTVLAELLASEGRWARLGNAARRDFSQWSRRWSETLFLGFEKPIREVLEGRTRPQARARRGGQLPSAAGNG